MKVYKTEAKMSNDTRLALLEQSIGHINESLKDIKDELKAIDNKVDNGFRNINNKMDNGFQDINNRVDTGFRDINNRLWFNFIWVVGGFIGVLTLIGRLFHWF